MQSKIRIEFDFDTSQPVLRITHAKDSDDLRDTMLKAFIEKASLENSVMYVTYPKYDDTPPTNSIVEIRCEINPPQTRKMVSVPDNSEAFRDYLLEKNIPFFPNGSFTDLHPDTDFYTLFKEFGRLYERNN